MNDTIKVISPEEMNEQITDHFKVKEMVCRCGCNKIIIIPALFYALETLRADLNQKYSYGVSIVIMSGFRCEKSNSNITQSTSGRGGYHPLGLAADIRAVLKRVPLPLPWLYKAASDSRLFNGLGYYRRNGIIHVDIRPEIAFNRWFEKEDGTLISLTRG